MTDRATVRIVEGGEMEQVHTGAPVPDGNAPEGGPRAAEDLPRVSVPVGEGEEPTVGGDHLPNPSAEQIVAASGGSIADQMRARFDNIAATEEFPVPGWELASGDPGLIVVARTFGDKTAYAKGLGNEAFIARSTHELVFVDDRGQRQVIEGGWGPQLATMMGVKVAKATELIDLVISKPDPSAAGQRIPNVAGIGTLAMAILEWAGRGVAGIEDDLGE